MRVLIAILLLFAMSQPVRPAERNNECALLWDAALVARALAEDSIPEAQIVRVMARIYAGQRTTMTAVAKLAIASPLPAHIFAGAIRNRCNSLTKKQET